MRKPYEILFAVASGPERRRALLTPVRLLIIAVLVFLILVGSLLTDRMFGLPKLLPGTSGSLIGLLLLGAGLPLWACCVLVFRRAKGTPVPFNPPRELIMTGPYAFTRNPMAIGVFACLFGLGFLFKSVSMVFVWTPIAFGLHALALKRLEEPELELRFGPPYREYRRRVPMFVPKVLRVDRHADNHASAGHGDAPLL